MAGISFESVSKRYDDGTLGVDGLDLDVPNGGFTVLVGPSGCGKSTALRVLAGLEDVTEGEVRIGGRVVNDLPPKDRDIAMVFQSYALYPHMTVADNMGFALRMRGIDRAIIRERVAQTAEMLGITELLRKRPRQLSGGQRQRVALGRSVVREPRAFLMDEPLSNLDAKLRVEMRGYLQGLHGELGVTTVYVTHDQTEAMTMGDRVAVMRGGRIEQVDEPQALYERPANLFVASFIGSPAMNLARGRLEPDGDGVVLLLGPHRIRMSERLAPPAGRDVIAGLRPEALELADGTTPRDRVLELPVLLTEALGSDVLAYLELDAPPALTSDMEDVARELGDRGSPDGRTRLTARLAPQAGVRAGQHVALAVDPERIHLFDPETERALD